MSFKNLLTALIMAMMLAGCGGNVSEPRRYQLPPNPVGGGDPPAPSSTIWKYHYLGLMWGAWAGPVYAYSASACSLIDFAHGQGQACIDNVTLDGTPATEANLRTGQIVELDATITNTSGTASIDIRRTVVGPVEAIDAAHLRLTVLGQQVYVIDQTQGDKDSGTGDAFDFAGVAVGDRVSVSGHFSTAGQVIATLIEHDLTAGPLILRGILASRPNGLFAIGDILVDLSGATSNDFPAGAPKSADAVLLFADSETPGGILKVQNARYAGGPRDPMSGTTFEYTGFITAENGPFDFDIDGYRFVYSTWDCDACMRLDSLSKRVAIGTAVSFFNDVRGNNYLELNPPTWNGTQLIGPIDSVDPGAAAFTVAGFTVQTSPATHISADKEPWVGSDTREVGELTVGDTVTVTGGTHLANDYVLVAGSVFPDGDGVRIYTEQYNRADPDIIFQGQSIRTDAGTVVTACNNDGACAVVDPQWLFDNTDYFQPTLTINIDTNAIRLRAASILAQRD